MVTAVEQVASTLRWTRSGLYDQHVVGYRSQQSGPNISTLSWFQTGWLNPTLYGNRLRIRTRNSKAPPKSVRSDGADTLPAVHPLAADRDAYYTFSGGDTIVTITLADRSIPIARVRVTPRPGLATPVVLFEGEMELDASRGTLVRLRGMFVQAGGSRRRLTNLKGEAVAFIEFEQGERNGSYWLPAKQRIELQATLPVLGDSRAVIRIVSRFADMMVNDTVLSAATLAAADSTRALSRRTLSFAPTDSLDRYGRWMASIGGLSEEMHSDDFMDIGPDRWRPYGAPRFDWVAPRASDILRYNRVEGAFTGLGMKWALRDKAPGVVVRATAGWAWNEQTARGRVIVERTRGPWTVEAWGGRSLDNTNDFRVPFDSGNSFAAIFSSQDRYDYVDRRGASMSVVRRIAKRGLQLRAELGVADDRYQPATLEHGPFGGNDYRPNRGVDEGSFVRTAAMVDFRPDVSAEFLKPGVSMRALYERGDGTLSFQRIETRVVARLPMGPLVAVGRGEIGTLISGRPPAQQLFEIGEHQNLPGYEDKEFAGTTGGVLRGSLLYTSPFLRQPMRFRQFFLPAIAPGLSVGVQSGWTSVSSAAGLEAISRLAVAEPGSTEPPKPVSRPSDGMRASVTAGLRFFSGGVFAGVSRPVDQSAPWRFMFTLGQQW